MNEYEIMIKNLENRVTELEKLTQCGGGSTLTVIKWQPKGGDWYVSGYGNVVEVNSTNKAKVFGTERDTYEQAERAAVEMRRFNRLLALRDELCGDDDVYWGDDYIEKYNVYFSHERKCWYVSTDIFCESIQPYFTTKESAQEACDMLNSGEVEL